VFLFETGKSFFDFFVKIGNDFFEARICDLTAYETLFNYGRHYGQGSGHKSWVKI